MSEYWVKVFSQPRGQWRTSGKLIYNERDRFNILMTGTNHKQQSLIYFQANIPRDNDSRVMGFGVGDDSQYVLSARVCFASRVKFPDAYVKTVVDDATARVLTANGGDPILQLPLHIISEIFQKHPIPVTTPIVHSRPYEYIIRMINYVSVNWRF